VGTNIEASALVLGLTSKALRRCASLAIFLLVANAPALLALGRVYVQNEPGRDAGPDPAQLMRDVVANELKADKDDHSRWEYTETRQHGRQGDQRLVVETPDGDVYRLTAQNGHPLTPEAAKREDARISKIAQRPEAFRERIRKERQDAQQGLRFLKMLPNAFIYHYSGQQGNMIKLDFTPNPSFKPQEREGEVFHHMQGSVWIDATQKRLARMDGRLVSEVKFGGGFLGHLAKGGTFAFEQKDEGGGHWEMTQLTVNMNGRVLFFKTIAVHQDEKHTDFKPVPSDVTLADAVKMLKSADATAARNSS
jgi:hypothetical protein